MEVGSGAQLMLLHRPNQRAPHIISPCHNTLPLEVEQTLTFQAFFFLAFYFKIITILSGEHLCCGEFYAAIMFHAILRQLFYHTVIQGVPKKFALRFTYHWTSHYQVRTA